MQRFSSAFFLPAICLIALLPSRMLRADPIEITAAPVPSFVLSPANDSLTLDLTSATSDVYSGLPFTLQTGVFSVGDSGSLAGELPFSFEDTITLGGVTQVVTISGVDYVTVPSDSLQIQGSGPIAFGDLTLTVLPFTLPNVPFGANDTVYLQATVTPEPAALLLVVTGLAGWGLLAARRRRASEAAGGGSAISL